MSLTENVSSSQKRLTSQQHLELWFPWGPVWTSTPHLPTQQSRHIILIIGGLKKEFKCLCLHFFHSCKIKSETLTTQSVSELGFRTPLVKVSTLHHLWAEDRVYCRHVENRQCLFTVHTVHRAGLTTCRAVGRYEEGAAMRDQLNTVTRKLKVH